MLIFFCFTKVSYCTRYQLWGDWIVRYTLQGIIVSKKFKTLIVKKKF